jgi:hypothetical protein
MARKAHHGRSRSEKILIVVGILVAVSMVMSTLIGAFR